MFFKDVVGQKELKKNLIKQVRSEKVPHAILLNGKPGYGTLPLALAYAQYLLCENKTEEDSCGICNSCLKTKKLQHPDLHFSYPSIQAVSRLSDAFLTDWREIVNEKRYFDLYDWIKKIDTKERKPIIGVDESKSILQKLSLKSFEGGYKIMLIWSMEAMHLSCSNKLLKIIEEPQPKTIFILISASVETILPTIISRVQLINVPKIEQEPLQRYLVDKLNMGEAPAQTKAAFSEGDLVSLANEEGLIELHFDLFVKLMRICYKKNVVEMLNWAEEISGYTKEHQKTFISYSLHLFRMSILHNYHQEKELFVSEKEMDFLSKFAAFITGNNIELFMKKFNEAYLSIDRNANTKIMFSQLSFWVMRAIHRA